MYKQADTLTIPDPIEQGVFNADPNALAKFRKIAVNVGVLEDNTVCLESTNRAHFVAQSKQIKLGMQATDAKDFVTLDQVVHEEQKLVEYISTDEIPESKTAKYINEGRLFFCPNPKTTQSGNFTIQNSAPPSLISEEK